MTELTANVTNLFVKRVDIADLPLVVKLFNDYRVFYKQPEDTALAERFLKQRLLNNESIVFVVLDGDMPVAFTQLYPKYSSVSAVKNWILNDLYVDERYRRQGLGKLLIDTAINFAKTDGAKFVQLETAVDNFNAQHLYETIGFKKQVPDNDYLLYRINVE